MSDTKYARSLGSGMRGACAASVCRSPPGREAARISERDWQREQLPEQISVLALDDQRLRNEICWFVFDE
jgi:hypothetical protein